MGLASTVKGLTVRPVAAKPVARVTPVTPAKAKPQSAPVAATRPSAQAVTMVGSSILLDVVAEYIAGDRPAPGGVTVWPTHLRASQVSDYCPRAEAIIRVYGEAEQAFAIATGAGAAMKIPVHLAVTFGLGTALHSHLQNEVLGPAGVLFGRWRCTGCHAVWGGATPSEWVRKPEVVLAENGVLPMWSSEPRSRVTRGKSGASLACANHTTEFVEAYAEDSHLKLSGHMDGAILVGGVLTGLEAKTISERQFIQLRSPLSHQIVQANIYMHLFGLKQILFVYVSKGWHPHEGRLDRPTPLGKGHQYGPLKEFLIRADPRIISKLLLAREQVDKAVSEAQAGNEVPFPPRLTSCKGQFSSRAQTCAACSVCFGL